MDNRTKRRKQTPPGPGLLMRIFEGIRGGLASLRITIPLLIILATVSIIGTLIQQNLAEEEYVSQFGILGYRILDLLGLFDVYHSWWYITLFILLTMNLFACSLRRFPSTWRISFQPTLELDERFIKALPFKTRFKKQVLPEGFKEKCERILMRTFAKTVKCRKRGGTLCFYSEKGRLSRFSVYFTHFGIVVILIGSVIGLTFGLKGSVNILEGGSADRIFLRGNQSSMELGFQVRCDDFSVSLYPGNNSRGRIPKEYKSVLTVVDHGKEVLKKDVRVNHPLRYKGFSFFQSSYGTATWEGGDLLVEVASKHGKKETKKYSVSLGGSFNIEGTSQRVKFTRLVPDFFIGNNGKVSTRSLNMHNPAALLNVMEGERPLYSVWVFEKFPDFHGKDDGDYIFSFIGFKGKDYTVLMVSRDPGVWVVWFGCTFLVLGVLGTFFFSHRRVWIRMTEEDGENEIVLAGDAGRNKEGFQRKFEQLKEALGEGLRA